MMSLMRNLNIRNVINNKLFTNNITIYVKKNRKELLKIKKEKRKKKKKEDFVVCTFHVHK